MKKPLVVAAAALALVLAVPGTAQARPDNPLTDYTSVSDIGPDHTGWYCTYQASVRDTACVRTSSRPGAIYHADPFRWWNPWTWHR